MQQRGREERETLLLNLLLHDVNVAAGGHVDLNLTLPTDLVLVAKEEAVLQGMTQRQAEIGRCYGMEMNVEINQDDENLRDHGRKKTKKQKNRRMSKITAIWAAL